MNSVTRCSISRLRLAGLISLRWSEALIMTCRSFDWWRGRLQIGMVEVDKLNWNTRPQRTGVGPQFYRACESRSGFPRIIQFLISFVILLGWHEKLREFPQYEIIVPETNSTLFGSCNFHSHKTAIVWPWYILSFSTNDLWTETRVQTSANIYKETSCIQYLSFLGLSPCKYVIIRT